MQNQSFLIFGREPSVSFAELYQFLGGEAQNIALAAPAGAIINDESLGKDAPLHLAGVIKSGEIIKSLGQLKPEDIVEILQRLIKTESKFHFGLSLYRLAAPSQTLTPARLATPASLAAIGFAEGMPAGNAERSSAGWRSVAGGLPSLPRNTRDRLWKGEGNLKKLGLSVKKILKDAGRSVRLVESRSGNLSSVDVAKNKLLRTGAELCIFITQQGFLIGKTEAVQPFEDYSRRDYDRPGRDAKSGMLPPKLALAMINMAVGQKHDLTILDPFCGSGTVLQEALLLGHKVIGTDIDEQSIINSKLNLEWLFNRYPEAESTRHKLREGSRGQTRDSSAPPQNDAVPYWRVEQVDTRQIGKLLPPQSMDAIVTEFDLGPPLQGGESVGKIDSIVFSLNDFYFDALRALLPILKSGGRAVVAWPHFRTQNVFVDTFSKLRSLGWSLVAPYPAEFEKNFPLSERGTLLYGREGQHVGREILLLKKAGTQPGV